MSLGQLVTTPDGATWSFDAGGDGLDLAYALGELHGARAVHAVSDAPTLRAWLAERHPQLELAESSDGDLRDARALGAALARLALARLDGRALRADDIDTLNLYAATPDIPPALVGGTRLAGGTRVRISNALSSIARDGIRVLRAEPSGLGRCAAEECGLLFHDESRTRSRRWCSMSRCGNRAKVRALRARAAASR